MLAAPRKFNCNIEKLHPHMSAVANLLQTRSAQIKLFDSFQPASYVRNQFEELDAWLTFYFTGSKQWVMKVTNDGDDIHWSPDLLFAFLRYFSGFIDTMHKLYPIFENEKEHGAVHFEIYSYHPHGNLEEEFQNSKCEKWLRYVKTARNPFVSGFCIEFELPYSQFLTMCQDTVIDNIDVVNMMR